MQQGIFYTIHRELQVEKDLQIWSLFRKQFAEKPALVVELNGIRRCDQADQR